MSFFCAVRQCGPVLLGGATIDEIADRERCTKRHVADTLPLAFLAPGLVRAVMEARLPRGISTRSIAEPDLEWSRQWTTLGISAGPEFKAPP